MRIAVLFFAALILMVGSVDFAVSATKGGNNGLTIWLLSMVNMIVAMMNNEKYKADCLLWALWVDEQYREQGAAKMLIARAELEAKQHGCKSIALEWSADESEEWVL